MKNKENASLSIVKIICVSIILVLISGIGVLAVNRNMTDVKIILQNGHKYKMGYWDVKSISENQTISNSYGKFKCKWNDEK